MPILLVMKIVVGTRRYLGTDWTHVDADPHPLVDPQGILHPVDVVCDARAVDLPDHCAELVYSQECLEHFPWAEAPKVLAEWARLVAPGGTLRIEVPDFLAACNQALSTDTEEMDFAIQQIIFGGQINQYDFHYTGLTPRMLTRWMTEQGLVIVSVERGFEVGYLRVVGTRP